MVFRKIGKRVKYFATTALDRAKFSLVSIGYLLKRPAYLLSFLVALFVFLYLLSFFKDGMSNWSLLCSNLPLGSKLNILGQVAAKILNNFTDLYGVLIIFMSILQALTVMLLIRLLLLGKSKNTSKVLLMVYRLWQNSHNNR